MSFFHVLFQTIFRTPSLQNGINLFVCNMSLSDMIMCLTAAPLTPITSFTGRWFLGELPCKILPACQVHIEILFIGKISYILDFLRDCLFTFPP